MQRSGSCIRSVFFKPGSTAPPRLVNHRGGGQATTLGQEVAEPIGGARNDSRILWNPQSSRRPLLPTSPNASLVHLKGIT